MRSLYIYTEDLAGAYIGPFTDIPAVLEHIKFCHERGDASMSNTDAHIEIMVMEDSVAETMRRARPNKSYLFLTPEEDRAFDVETARAKL